MRKSLIRRTRHWIVNRGIAGTLAECSRRLPLLFRYWRRDVSAERQAASQRPALHPFDTLHGVDTSGLIWGENLAVNNLSSYWATGYYGISPSVFWQAIDRLNLHWERFTFIDVGSGKGRAMMLAQRYPFRRMIGLELSPDLLHICESNIRKFNASWSCGNPIHLIGGDAANFFWPPENSVIFLYHPFARPVMVRFVQHLQASLRANPREIYLVYANPELHETLIQAGFLVKLWDDFFAMAQEDMTADFFGSHAEHIAVYRNL
jgi:hypothetical protein